MGSPAGQWELFQPTSPALKLEIFQPDSQGNFQGTLGGTTIFGTWNQNTQVTFLTYPLLPNVPLPAAVYTGTIFANGQSMGGTVSAGFLEVIIAIHNHRPIPPPEPWFAIFQGPIPK